MRSLRRRTSNGAPVQCLPTTLWPTVLEECLSLLQPALDLLATISEDLQDLRY